MCISFLILWIFRKLILCHIQEIHQYLKSSTENKFKIAGPLKLNRAADTNDEFTNLTLIINDMVQIISAHQEILTKKLDETTQNLEKQKERSIQAAKMASLGEMAGGISHEINNPLTIISGKISILRRKNEMGPILQTELAEYLDLMSKTSERIAKIIKGLKTFARDGTNDPMTPCSLNQILLDSLIICDDKIKRNGIILNMPNIHNCQINAREVEISQIIVNLISNSIDAIEHLEEKWIKIISHYQDGFVELSFVDSGNGIDKDVANKIMEPFFTTKDVNKGTGLGLSISKGIIESHGGKLFIDHSKSNTTFVMRIPATLIEKVS
jgi:C4-dicarboxylate-specific signal transduction histidine kinase